jgi:hypothetical protein
MLIETIVMAGVAITTIAKSNPTTIADTENILFIGAPFTDATIISTSIT